MAKATTNNQIRFELTQRQTSAWKLLTDERNAQVLYGGAKGGGKSFLFCLWVFAWSQHLIQFFQLKDPTNPLPVGFIGRLQGIDFEKTTLETWKRIIPRQCYEIKEQKKEIIVNKLVKIFYGGLDSLERVQKFNSAELAFIAIDQAEEVEQADIAVLEASLRLKVGEKTPPYKVLYTANPRHGWLKDQFVKAEREGAHFIKALPSDNPHLPANYEDTLKQAFSYAPSLLAAYLHGEWDVYDGIYFESFRRSIHVYDPQIQVIHPSWPRFRSIDWGFSSPMACLWHAVGPDKHIYTYREYYKTHQLDVDAAKEIVQMSEGETIQYTVADPQSFPVEIPHYKFGRMMSVKRSEVWSEHGVPVTMGDSERVAGWARVREYLQPREYMGGMSPYWHISSDCVNLIDELLSATHDKRKVEDVSATCSDHALESARLALMSRPPLLREPEKPKGWLEMTRDFYAKGKTQARYV